EGESRCSSSPKVLLRVSGCRAREVASLEAGSRTRAAIRATTKSRSRLARGHVAVRAGADDIEGLRKRGADGSGALQDRAEGVELSGGPMGEVGKRAVADLAAETKRLAKEDSGRGVAVGHCGDIHAYIIQISEHNS